MLNTDGYVSECTGDNLFVVKNGQITTPPAAAAILHGLTRHFVMEELAPHLGHNVEERMMKLDEVMAADEVFLTGTAAEIIGVDNIDGQTIGCGQMGPVTQKLAKELPQARRGQRAGGLGLTAQ